MMTDRVFLDTSFVLAMIDRRDQYHDRARAIRPMLDRVEVVTTEAVLVEVGNALSSWNRPAACSFVDRCYRTPTIAVVAIDTGRILIALTLYRSRTDKAWGLTDCLSFGVMREYGLLDALTADRHFVQAGFRALMLEEG